MSTSEPTPNENKCDQKHIAPKSILVVDADKKSTFHSCFNIYLSFYSETGISIQLTANFIDVNEFRKNNMK